MSAAESQPAVSWQARLHDIMEMMREMSRQTDPQEMVAAYGRRLASILTTDCLISLSRRGLQAPCFRVTRFSGWKEQVNPWKEPERLPVLKDGVLGRLLYAGEPQIIDDLQVSDDDPASAFLDGQRSLMAIPMLDGGEALNMVVLTRAEPHAFDKEQFPEIVWTSMLFGRSTHNLLLAEQVQHAYNTVDQELKVVGDIQRSLLPAELPHIPGVTLAADYRTSQRAGGDYYDFFPLPGGRWGFFIADVSGHGTPAAVMMAITHSIAHMFPSDRCRPSEMLRYLNRHLTHRYTNTVGAFVTAFYGVYDPQTHRFVYSSAGHNPPRIKHCADGSITALNDARRFPLGILPDVEYDDAEVVLQSGDQLLMYTDGITEAEGPDGAMFGVERLDQELGRCRHDAREIVDGLLTAVEEFTGNVGVIDDRTLVVAKIE